MDPLSDPSERCKLVFYRRATARGVDFAYSFRFVVSPLPTFELPISWHLSVSGSHCLTTNERRGGRGTSSQTMKARGRRGLGECRLAR